MSGSTEYLMNSNLSEVVRLLFILMVICLSSHIIYRYIDPSRHNFEICLLPLFLPLSCFGWPLAARLAQTALRGKIME